MRSILGLAVTLALVPGLAQASEAGDRLPELLYSGAAAAERGLYEEQCAASEADACFGLGLIDVIGAVEGLSQGFYRYGAAVPSMPAAAMLLGIDADIEAGSANPNPEPVTYDGLRALLDTFVADLDQARASFQRAGEGDDFVLLIDPLQVRFDLDGDGEVGEQETLAELLTDVLFLPMSRTKGDKTIRPDTTIGFDRADAFWFAGYSQVTASPVDFLLAHDFSQFFSAFGHRIFPASGLPMQDYSRGGALMMDAESDAFFADVLAAIHTINFPVSDADRLKGVLARMQAVTALSRQNWEAILAETDDQRELVPSPQQTSLVPDQPITEEIVAAWMETLDTVDEILAGELLVPHWRFRQGFDLKAYFETATETDLVMLFAGQGALPFLRDGPIADADSFAAGNAVFGDNWPNFIVWFN